MINSTYEERINELEARLSVLEASTSEKKQTAKNPVAPSNPRESKEISGNLLGWISSICFILAAGLIIKLSYDSGWLTHEKQLGIATLFGLALFVGGMFISNTDNHYARFLPAAGPERHPIRCSDHPV